MSVRVLQGDCRDVLRTLPDESVHCVVTSPPYFGLRDYGTAKWDGGDPACDHKASNFDRGERADRTNVMERTTPFRSECGKCGARRVDSQIGLEPTPDAYVAELVAVFREVRRVLRKDGTLWLNLGSSYASGGKRASQSREPSSAPACGSDGIEPDDFPETGSACSDPDGAHLGGSPNHHDRNSGNGQPLERDASPPLPIGHDTERSDSAEAFQPASRLGVPHPSVSSSLGYARDENGQRATASEPRPETPTFADGAPRFAHSSAYIDGIETTLVPSVDHKSGRVSSGSACNCGSCGICWARLAIPFLRFKPKDEINIPHLVAFALQADGWWLRQDIIWSKPNPMPESVTDRCTKAHEYVFLLTKSERYYFDNVAIAERSESKISQLPARQGEAGGLWQEREAQGISDTMAQVAGRTGLAEALPSFGKTESGSEEALRQRQTTGEPSTLPINGKGSREPPKRSPQAPRSHGSSDLRSDGGTVGIDQGDTGAQMRPLPTGEAADKGSHNPSLAGRTAYGIEYPSALPELQQSEEQQASYRTKRSVWHIATQPFGESHFAVMPPALVEPCILAGCPHKACAKCGSPWVREVEETADERPTYKTEGTGPKAAPNRNDAMGLKKVLRDDGKGGDLAKKQTRTIGFSPSCSCDGGTMPGTVLDPFGGAGTTGLVADRLQRNAILIELNPDYATMARRRIQSDAPLFAEAAE